MKFGVARLIADLAELGHANLEAVKAPQDPNQDFAVIRGFTVKSGRFAGQVVDLGIPAPPNYPQGVGAAIHVRSTPQLLPDGNSGKSNVVASALGGDWRYWSHNFGAGGERRTRELMAQINRIFDDA